ncbi:unnamed protein product [Timema podura]|uniref:Uncharacterized protein n=1 Tax=Timema podura TaxID=61482 RepID=A0ABN7NQ87_TIMPD|nr:unnamed protein product [Timema podura]
MVVIFLSAYLAASHREHVVGHAAWKAIHKPKCDCNTTTTSTTNKPATSATSTTNKPTTSTASTTKEPCPSTAPTINETSTSDAPTTKKSSTAKKSHRIHRREANPIYKKDYPRKQGRAPKYC